MVKINYIVSVGIYPKIFNKLISNNKYTGLQVFITFKLFKTCAK